MPNIESANPADIITPLQPLFPKVVQAVYLVAPDREREIAAIVNRYGLRIQLHENTGEFTMQAVASSFYPRLMVGLGSLERMWAAAFGYFVLFKISAEQHRRRRAGEPVGKATHPALAEAVTLLKWAFKEAHTERLPWPHAPSPSEPFPDKELMADVEKCFLSITAWMLLHEVGHFACGHCEPVDSTSVPDEVADSHRREHEADDWAHRQMLAVANDALLTGNRCSIPFALGVIAGLNHRETAEHPALADRLRRYTASYVDPFRQTRPEVFATAHMTAVVPLQTQLALDDYFPALEKPFADLEDYLAWWKGVMR